MMEKELKPIIPIGAFILDHPTVRGKQGTDGMYFHYRDVCTLLNDLKKTGQWVKLSDDKPVNRSYVLVTDGVYVDKCLYKHGVFWNSYNDLERYDRKVVKWQPLPEVEDLIS